MKTYLALISIPSITFAQSLGYADADSEGQALGMMKSSILIAETLQNECARRAPQTAKENASDLKKWMSNEASIIAKTEWYWRKFKASQPDEAAQVEHVPTVVKQNLESISRVSGKEGDKVIAQYCRQFFSELASGIWRVRTPNVYKYLDQARGEPK